MNYIMIHIYIYSTYMYMHILLINAYKRYIQQQTRVDG